MITTFYTPEEVRKYQTSSDKEINEILQEVNSLFERPFFVLPFRVYKERLFRSPLYLRTEYSLYHQLSDYDAQLINFAQELPYSLNIRVAKSYILTYLYGVCAGKQQ